MTVMEKKKNEQNTCCVRNIETFKLYSLCCTSHSLLESQITDS